MKKNPFATQKEIAEQIGKSERTIKTITVTLQKKIFFVEQMANAMDIGKL